jgi:hypothetical protein
MCCPPFADVLALVAAQRRELEMEEEEGGGDATAAAAAVAAGAGVEGVLAALAGAQKQQLESSEGGGSGGGDEAGDGGSTATRAGDGGVEEEEGGGDAAAAAAAGAAGAGVEGMLAALAAQKHQLGSSEGGGSGGGDGAPAPALLLTFSQSLTVKNWSMKSAIFGSKGPENKPLLDDAEDLDTSERGQVGHGSVDYEEVDENFPKWMSGKESLFNQAPSSPSKPDKEDSEDVNSVTGSSRSNRPKKGKLKVKAAPVDTPLCLFNSHSLLTVVIAVLVGAAQGIQIYNNPPIHVIVRRSYGILFCFLIVFVEMEWTALIRGNKMLQNWACRGLFYGFVGVLEWPDLMMAPGEKNSADGIIAMEQISACALILMGALYFVLGLLCCKSQRDLRNQRALIYRAKEQGFLEQLFHEAGEHLEEEDE